jgi:hypothetical protein
MEKFLGRNFLRRNFLRRNFGGPFLFELIFGGTLRVFGGKLRVFGGKLRVFGGKLRVFGGTLRILFFIFYNIIILLMQLYFLRRI